MNDTPSLNDLMTMMDRAEVEVNSAVDHISNAAKRMTNKGNGCDVDQLIEEQKSGNGKDHSFIVRMRRKINGSE